MILFFARRFFICCALTIFYTDIWGQWLSYFLTTLAVLSWTFGFKPYARKEKLNVEYICEIALMMIIMILPIFEFVDDKNIAFIMGWVINGIIIGANGILLIYCIAY